MRLFCSKKQACNLGLETVWRRRPTFETFRSRAFVLVLQAMYAYSFQFFSDDYVLLFLQLQLAP